MKKLVLALLFCSPIAIVLFGDIPVRAQNFSSTQPLTRTLNITSSTVLKAAQGVLICFNVITASSGSAGTINDVATTGAAATANQIATIPSAVGNYCVTFPFFTGLVVIPATNHVISVSYQ